MPKLLASFAALALIGAAALPLQAKAAEPQKGISNTIETTEISAQRRWRRHHWRHRHLRHGYRPYYYGPPYYRYGHPYRYHGHPYGYYRPGFAFGFGPFGFRVF